MDSFGNLFIADNENNRIRKVDTSGNVSTVAGNVTAGFSGDGGPATGAQLKLPTGVAVDSSGNLFIADHANHRIRKVDTSGNISTVAGDGTAGFGGDGGPATSAQLKFTAGVALDSPGNLLIADPSNNRIRKLEAVATAAPVPGVGTWGLIGLAVHGGGARDAEAQASQVEYGNPHSDLGSAATPDGTTVALTACGRHRLRRWPC